MKTVIEQYNCRVLALISLASGIIGMMICAPFMMFSPVQEATLTAIPFVAGVILFAAGVICLTVQSYKGSNTAYAAPQA